MLKHPQPPSCADYGHVLAHPTNGSAVPCAGCSMPTRESEVLSRLPVLLEQGNFPEWDAYLRRVYGEADPPVYPIDLGRLSWLYYDDLPIILAPVQRAPQCAGVYGHAWISPVGCPYPSSRIGAFGVFVQHYHPSDGLRSTTHLHGERRNSLLGVANHTWVEVQRTATNHPLELCSFWYFHAPGSGVWWNVGRTYVATASEGRAEEHWFPTPRTFDHGQFVRRHSVLSCKGSEALRRLIHDGYDSLQIPDISGMGLTNHFEIIDLRHWKLKGGNHSTSKCSRSHDEYRSGFNASQSCSCYSIEPSENTDVPVSMIGCRELPQRNCGPRSAFKVVAHGARRNARRNQTNVAP